MKKPRTDFAFKVAEATRRLEAAGIVGKTVLQHPGGGGGKSRRPGTELHRVKTMRDGKRLSRDEAALTFKSKPWAKTARFIASSCGWFVWEFVP